MSHEPDTKCYLPTPEEIQRLKIELRLAHLAMRRGEGRNPKAAKSGIKEIHLDEIEVEEE